MESDECIEFRFPLHLEDLELPKNDRYCVTDPLNEDDIKENECLDEIVHSTRTDYTSITNNDVFDKLYSIIKFWESTSNAIKKKAIDCAVNGLQLILIDIIDNTQENADLSNQTMDSMRNSLKMWVFLLGEIALTGEKEYADQLNAASGTATIASGKTSRGRRSKKNNKTVADEMSAELQWEYSRQQVLSALVETVESNFLSLWSHGICEEDFASLLMRVGCVYLANSTGASDATRSIAGNLVTLLPRKVATIVPNTATVIVNLIQNYEKLPKAFAEVFGTSGGEEGLLAEVLREVGRLNLTDSKDTAGVKNIATFITEIAATAPIAVLKVLSVLLPHMDADSYTVRSALVTALGHVIRNISDTVGERKETDVPQGNQEENHQRLVSVRTRDALLDVLEEHCHDVHALTRAASLKTFTKLVADGALPLSRWSSISALAIDRLKDKSSMTRRAAMQLLTSLLENNPFAPNLSPEPFQQNLIQLEAKMKQMSANDASEDTSDNSQSDSKPTLDTVIKQEESDMRILQYCKTTLQFALTIATCVPVLCQLLGSRVATDVLEAIGFLRRARAFNIPGAENGLARMLTLIWSSDKAIQAAVLDAFLIEYLTEPKPIIFDDAPQSRSRKSRTDDEDLIVVETEGQPRIFRPPPHAAMTLVHLATDATVAQRASLEQTLCLLAQREQFDVNAMEALWQIVGRSVAAMSQFASQYNSSKELQMMTTEQQTSITQGRSAMCIISMLASSMPRAVDSDQGLTRLLAVLAGPTLAATNQSEQQFSPIWDYRLAHYACVAASKVCAVRNGPPGTAAAIASALVAIQNTKEAEASHDTRLTTKSKSKKNKTNQTDILTNEIPDTSVRSRAIANLIMCTVALIRGDWDTGTVEDPYWFSAAEAAISALFVLAPQPERVCEILVRQMAEKCFPHSTDENTINPSMRRSILSDGISIGQSSSEWISLAAQGVCSRTALARLFFVLGHTALKLLVHCEALTASIKRTRVHVAERIQRQRDASSNRTNPTSSKTTPKRVANTASTGGKNRRRKSIAGETNDSLEEQLGGGGVTDDREVELVARLAETQFVCKGLLGSFGPLIARVAANSDGTFSDIALANDRSISEETEQVDPLRQSAVLALAKYMCISSEFCERYLPLQFTILERAHSSALRATIAVALADLAFRFPNLVEPWTEKLYLRLRDDDARVRKNTLMVLTHLILNDMIKVKGQVAEIAVCLQDNDPRIVDLTRLFFHELSKRGSNPIYNILPDVIACLANHPMLQPKNPSKYTSSSTSGTATECISSDETSGKMKSSIIHQQLESSKQMSTRKVGAEAFRDIMRFLLGFVSKGKHVEGLMERLIGRFDAMKHSLTAGAPASATIELSSLSLQSTKNGMDNAIPENSDSTFANNDGVHDTKLVQTPVDHEAERTTMFRHLAFCMSQLPYSDKAYKRLMESWKSYKHALHDPKVYGFFTILVTKAKKHCKQEMSVAVTEWSDQINTLYAELAQGMRDHISSRNVTDTDCMSNNKQMTKSSDKSVQRSSKTSMSNTRRKTSRNTTKPLKNKQADSDCEEEFTSEDDENDIDNTNDSESENDIDNSNDSESENTQPTRTRASSTKLHGTQQQRRHRTTSYTSRQRIVVDSDSEEEEQEI